MHVVDVVVVVSTNYQSNMTTKGERREKKRNKKRKMKVNGRGVQGLRDIIVQKGKDADVNDNN